LERSRFNSSACGAVNCEPRIARFLLACIARKAVGGAPVAIFLHRRLQNTASTPRAQRGSFAQRRRRCRRLALPTPNLLNLTRSLET
jgi:hypothetical protein